MKIEDLPTSFWVGVIKEDGKEVDAFGYKRQYTELGKPVQWIPAAVYGNCKYISIYLREQDEVPIFKHKISDRGSVGIIPIDKLNFIAHNWTVSDSDLKVDWRLPSYD